MGMGEESRPRPGDGDIDASRDTTSTSGPSTVRLYETRRGFHLAGGRQTSSNGGTTWRVVRIGRLETVSGGLDAVEDPHAYDDDALERLLEVLLHRTEALLTRHQVRLKTVNLREGDDDATLLIHRGEGAVRGERCVVAQQ